MAVERRGRSSQGVEYAVLALAAVAFLVLWIFDIGPAPLLILPWLVIALVVARLLTRNVAGGADG